MVGTVTEEAASRTGLCAGTPVVTGVVDVAACALALGILHPGQAYSILGTTCFNAFLTHESPELFQPPGVGISVFYPLQGAFLRAMATMSGTLSLDWFLTHVLGKEKEFCENKGTPGVSFSGQVLLVDVIGSENVVHVKTGSDGNIIRMLSDRDFRPSLDEKVRIGIFPEDLLFYSATDGVFLGGGGNL